MLPDISGTQRNRIGPLGRRQLALVDEPAQGAAHFEEAG